jgi:hypothetical protein
VLRVLVRLHVAHVLVGQQVLLAPQLLLPLPLRGLLLVLGPQRVPAAPQQALPVRGGRQAAVAAAQDAGRRLIPVGGLGVGVALLPGSRLLLLLVVVA